MIRSVCILCVFFLAVIHSNQAIAQFGGFSTFGRGGGISVSVGGGQVFVGGTSFSRSGVVTSFGGAIPLSHAGAGYYGQRAFFPGSYYPGYGHVGFVQGVVPVYGVPVYSVPVYRSVPVYSGPVYRVQPYSRRW
ncbi:MAG TPA: hypothetical protein PKA63_06690 [Oligoflexia bacterium]|nr:hypothetical protein [Oligoflexia bacterium]HMP48337.1 hypothetical protein [Oligoflexia bacterium]